MSNETDLDWLARNVHKWVPNELLRMKPCDNGNGTFRASWCYSDEGGFTKDQWLSRRAELQNKPSWADFGELAKFMAQDSDGAWMAFEIEPTAKSHVWSAMRGWCGYAREGSDRCCGEVLGDWRGTLEKRPEQAAFTPFTSIKDNQEKDMTQRQEVKQDNGWFERGELPPVGVSVQWRPGSAGRWEHDSWIDVDVIAHAGDGDIVIKWDGQSVNNKQLVTASQETFRPVRTERDELIEIIKKTDDTDDKIADAILAAGFSLRDK